MFYKYIKDDFIKYLIQKIKKKPMKEITKGI